MGSAILFNAARMQEIEDRTVTSGLVDVSGHLILKTHDNTEIDAGEVKGETGPAGADGTNGTNGTDGTDAFLPTGMISATAVAVAPVGYLLCDGAAVSRTTYSVLFAAIGTQFGTGDGSTTFNVPNLKGRVIVGIDAGQTEFDVRGETGGAKTHTLTVAEMPSHNHSGNTNTSVAYNTSAVYGTGGSTNLFALTWGGSLIGNDSAYQNRTSHSHVIPSQGGGGAHNNLQPYLALNYIIKT